MNPAKHNSNDMKKTIIVTHVECRQTDRQTGNTSSVNDSCVGVFRRLKPSHILK